MSNSVQPPALPIAPQQYDSGYQEQFARVLRLFFAQLVADGYLGAVSLTLGSTFPTDADLANLADGQVYIDTANGNVLVVKGGSTQMHSPYPLIWLDM